MRYFLTTSLLVASLAGQIYGHRQHTHAPHDEGRRRKSLGFGPEHPHAVFHSTPYQIRTNGFAPMDASSDPMDVARAFVKDILPNSTFKLRSDSYTDKNTGVTHVYVRQLVNGLEVTDGDMNLNIKDGVVLSYGNSFFNGPTPAPYQSSSNSPTDVRRQACERLVQSFAPISRPAFDTEQVVMGQKARPTPEMEHLLATNCDETVLPTQFTKDDPLDVRPALLTFMANATPNKELAADIRDNVQKHAATMEVTMINHLVASDERPLEFTVSNVPDTVSPVKSKLAYIQVPNESGTATELQLVWKFEVEMEDNWYETAVSTQPPHNIVSVVDWAADAPIPKPDEPVTASYKVFNWGINDPSEGKRTLEKENFDRLASPAGWHAIPYANDPSWSGSAPKGAFWRNTTTTWGNNVFAQENWEGQNQFIDNYRPDAGNSKVFDFPYDPKLTEKPDAQDEAQKYINATIAQLFYTSNMVHDLYYRYGFDEVSGNFQAYNFERGGKGNDAVIANAQDGSGYNNANFMTPPDGQNGRMRMYLWNTALPFRDGDLEAGIVIHELSHGLSIRLTGGPANSGCLGWGESGGMGEGWGDFLATTIRSTSTYSDYPMGSWAANRDNGIRNFPYSLDTEINPSTYKTLDKPGYWGVHAVGEVWAEILWVVSNRLIAKHGFTSTLFPPAPLEDGSVPLSDFYRTPTSKKAPLVPKHGNSLAVQLVLNGMKLQPCRPSFFDARDAIIQADQVLTGGENFCELWKGFSERGLGVNAKVEGKTPWGGGVRTNGYQAPPACSGDEEPSK